MHKILQKLLFMVMYMNESVSRGYLNEPYRLFHSTDKRDADFEAHSHDFHKMVFCLKGRVTYIMEGNSYELQSGDMLLIPQGQIHRSILHGETEYERMILWVKDSFLCSFGEEALLGPFAPRQGDGALYRPVPSHRGRLMEKLTGMERSLKSDLPGARLMQDTWLIQFLLELNGQLALLPPRPMASVRTDPKVQEILQYINSHLSEEMTVEQLSRRFFISSSHLMHTFRQHAGCSVHQYIRQKRLSFACDRLREGERVLQAAAQAGFRDYSAFLKAFRSQYGYSPREMK
ncbi:MAG: helix-turn-helix domain-containing protein [Clostridia bacterium]|nr:helix-turn-helix domain-containing protein [Clostridia bacterium]MBR6753606.1 helix-turn-helix domain-containing protein [Clostridia bacterium]